MSRLTKSSSFRRTFRISRHQPDVSRDINDEIDFYIDMRSQELVREGVEPSEARRQAEAAFGDRRAIEDACLRIDEPLVRRRRRTDFFGAIARDARHALRDMRKRPAFALAVCLTLAVCIALNTGVFALVHTVLLKPLPYPEPGRLVAIFNTYPKAGFPRASNTVPEYFDRKTAVEALEDVALYQLRTRSIGEPGAVRRDFAMIVTPSFFRVLGIEPFLGQTFPDDVTEPGRGRTAVISFALWQEYFGGDPEVLGKALRVDGVDHTVVAVMPAAFRFPEWEARLWLPITITDTMKSQEGRLEPDYDMIARLRPGATIAQAQAQVDAWNEILLGEVPPGFRKLLVEGGFGTRIVGFHADLVRKVEKWLYLLWSGAFFVLLIGGVSLASLILTRATGRLREQATRYVLGASRRRLAAQLVVENLVLALVGGTLGVLAGMWSLQWVRVFSAFDIPGIREVRLDPWVVAAILALAASVMTAVSLIAALTVRRRTLFAVLRAGTSTSQAGTLRLRGTLAAAQVAIAFVLLIGAALMSVSLWNLLAVDKGFKDDGVFLGAVNLPAERYAKRPDRQRFYEELLAELRSLPGVTHAAFASQVPPTSEDAAESVITPESFAKQPGKELLAHASTVVSPDYFAALDIPLLSGRGFDERDTISSPPVILVSEAVARRYWGGAEEAVGKCVFLGVDALEGKPLDDVEWHTVVGVVGDVVQRDLKDPAGNGGVYIPLWQQTQRFMRVVVATEGEPAELAGIVRDRVFGIDAEVVLFWTTTLKEQIADSLIHVRVPMLLLLVFAGVALLLAAVGIYGVLAQTVAQRTKEISVRMALGGSLRQIHHWVLGKVFVLVGAGLLTGLGGALALTRLMTSLLHEVQPTDPAVFLAVGALIGVVALLAAAIPAHRATRIDPVRALAAD